MIRGAAPVADALVQKGAFRSPKLAKSAPANFIAHLRQAHYDPYAQGLAELVFRVLYRAKKTETEVEAEAHWYRDRPLELKVTRATRKGSSLATSRQKSQLYHSLGVSVHHLLRGLGRGFLSERLAELAKGPPPQVKPLRGGGVELTYEKSAKEFSSALALSVERDLSVRHIARRSTRGMTRTMSYRFEHYEGRNLVREARLSVRFASQATIPKKVQRRLAATNNTLYQISYETVSGYRLPVAFYRTLPDLQDGTVLELKYKKVR